MHPIEQKLTVVRPSGAGIGFEHAFQTVASRQLVLQAIWLELQPEDGHWFHPLELAQANGQSADVVLGREGHQRILSAEPVFGWHVLLPAAR